MNQDIKQCFSSAGLNLNTSTGEVSNTNQKLRLSPVNSRVLNVLLKNAEKAVSRQQLFDQVWPNQVISDDALTRSISDLRSQLKNMTSTEPLIETIPKVGYRWMPAIESNHIKAATSAESKASFWSQNLKPMLLALAILLMLTWGLLGWLFFLSKPSATPIIILPTQHNHTINATNQNTDVTTCLKQAVMVQDNMQYLSAFALESHIGSPFPYYSHEFGVRWFIESQIIQKQDKNHLLLNLIDARTAMVIYSQQFSFKPNKEFKTHCEKFIAFVAEL